MPQKRKKKLNLFNRDEKPVMVRFRFLEDIAIADAAFEAFGKTLEELFESCALATFEVMVETKSVEPVKKKEIRLKSSDLESLLFDFLSEIIYLKDAMKIFYSKFDLCILKNKEYELSGTLWGDNIDYSRQKIRQDVKAVTYHLLEIKKTGDSWRAQVILDT